MKTLLCTLKIRPCRSSSSLERLIVGPVYNSSAAPFCTNVFGGAAILTNRGHLKTFLNYMVVGELACNNVCADGLVSSRSLTSGVRRYGIIVQKNLKICLSLDAIDDTNRILESSLEKCVYSRLLLQSSAQALPLR